VFKPTIEGESNWLRELLETVGPDTSSAPA
jgi:hypothetical protein